MKYIYWMLLCTTITGHSTLTESPTELPPSLSKRLPTHESPARLVRLHQARKALALARQHDEIQNPVAHGQALNLFFQSLGLGSKQVAEDTAPPEDPIADLTEQFSALSLETT